MATDWQVSEVGDTRRAAAGPGRRRSVKIEWLSAGTAHLGFPALLSVPHLLSREIKMNRRHWRSIGFFFIWQMTSALNLNGHSLLLLAQHKRKHTHLWSVALRQHTVHVTLPYKSIHLENKKKRDLRFSSTGSIAQQTPRLKTVGGNKIAWNKQVSAWWICGQENDCWLTMAIWRVRLSRRSSISRTASSSSWRTESNLRAERGKWCWLLQVPYKKVTKKKHVFEFFAWTDTFCINQKTRSLAKNESVEKECQSETSRDWVSQAVKRGSVVNSLYCPPPPPPSFL